MENIDIHRIDPWRLEVQRTGEMRTSGIVYASPELEKLLEADQAIRQVANVACLPGIVGNSIAMPDIHWGYGFPIGGVAAFSMDSGIISPGGVGYDINCGIRCIRTNMVEEEVRPVVSGLMASLYKSIPCGVGSRNKNFSLTSSELSRVMEKGAAWVVKKGFGDNEDLEYHEDRGCIEGAEPDEVSKKAIERGMPELGTLGSGNHFVEIDIVDEIYDSDTAGVFGLFKNQVLVQVHTGSRGLGHQVCDDFLHTMIGVAAKEGIRLPDRQLACAPLASREAKKYLGAMRSAANFAYANREIITFLIREVFEDFFSKSHERIGMSLLYDCCHNIAKIEPIDLKGRQVEVCIHRKGATRALPPGDKRLPERYIVSGQPVLVPGDMGRQSFILAAGKGSEQAFFSACHGAGRLLSRKEAKRQGRERMIIDSMKNDGIHLIAASRATIVEEMPRAYKDVSMVVDTVAGAGIASKVARLKPLGIIKG